MAAPQGRHVPVARAINTGSMCWAHFFSALSSFDPEKKLLPPHLGPTFHDTLSSIALGGPRLQWDSVPFALLGLVGASCETAYLFQGKAIFQGKALFQGSAFVDVILFFKRTMPL